MKVIAEVGSNIITTNDVFKCCTMAKEAGADYVKFQSFSEFDLYGVGSKCPKCQSLNPLLYESVKRHCDDIGIEFMCTGFSTEVYELINQHVSTHKIASSEITDMHILDNVNSFKKKVFLSTGGATTAQIKISLDVLKDCEVVLFYCVPDYPAKIVDFKHMLWLEETFEKACGYSDHSIDVLNIPILARGNGAKYLEKHVNFLDYRDTPDARHSLDYNEFKLMTDNLQELRPVVVPFKANPHQRVLANGKYVRPSPT